jgi:hypothetical protein
MSPLGSAWRCCSGASPDRPPERHEPTHRARRSPRAGSPISRGDARISARISDRCTAARAAGGRGSPDHRRHAAGRRLRGGGDGRRQHGGGGAAAQAASAVVQARPGLSPGGPPGHLGRGGGVARAAGPGGQGGGDLPAAGARALPRHEDRGRGDRALAPPRYRVLQLRGAGGLPRSRARPGPRVPRPDRDAPDRSPAIPPSSSTASGPAAGSSAAPRTCASSSPFR